MRTSGFPLANQNTSMHVPVSSKFKKTLLTGSPPQFANLWPRYVYSLKPIKIRNPAFKSSSRRMISLYAIAFRLGDGRF
jgi:hypothetical protein